MSYLYAKPSLSIFFLGTSAKTHKTYKHRLSGLFGKESVTAINRDSKNGWRKSPQNTEWHGKATYHSIQAQVFADKH